jgi:hypothetical protein
MAFFTPGQVAALKGKVVRMDRLVEFHFRTETLYYWNGNTELDHAGHVWLPMYGAATDENLGLAGGATQSDSVTFTLNGLPGELLAAALAETVDVDQQPVILYMQLFTEDWQPSGPPAAVFWGFMQPPRVNRSTMDGVQGATQSIQLVAENAFFNRSRPAYGRLTDRDQQTRSPGDKIMQFTASLGAKTIRYPDY